MYPQPHRNVVSQLIVCASLCLCIGCALGTARIKLMHDPLPTPPHQQKGSLVLERFTDTRNTGTYIGNKRNGYGMITGNVAADSVAVDSVLTSFVGEALSNIGYTVLPDTATTIAAADKTVAPILTGRIKKCWMDMYMVANAEVIVELALHDPATKEVLWQSTIGGEKVNLLWWGSKAEFANVYRGAFNYLLDTAQQRLSSSAFADKLGAGK